MSYWVKGGTAPTISGGVQSSNDAASADPDGWKYYEKTISGVTSLTISTSTSGIYLDDVRIYPKGAQMTTYTYTPLVGIITTTDANNKTSYYDYDYLGRLIHVKDPNKNITKQIKYNYRSGSTATGGIVP